MSKKKFHILTDRQRRVLNAVRDFIDEFDFSPSLEDLASRTGLSSSSTVKLHLRALEKKGLVRLPDKNTHRAIVLIDRFLPR